MYASACSDSLAQACIFQNLSCCYVAHDSIFLFGVNLPSPLA